jgi:SAM-dependent methyltransferase
MSSSRNYLEAEIRAFSDALPAGSRVLDAGAGDCRYGPLFHRHRYESADFAQVEKSYGRLDYVCDLRRIPVEDARFDAIACTQVLAHIPEPAEALTEMARVLKHGGKLLLTAPLFFHENEKPYDFFRFTQFGLRKLVADAGLEIDRLDWLEGYYGTLGYQMGVAARVLRVSPGAFGGGIHGVLFATLMLAVKPFCAAMALLMDRADLAYKNTEIGQCKNYVVIALKPQERTSE